MEKKNDGFLLYIIASIVYIGVCVVIVIWAWTELGFSEVIKLPTIKIDVSLIKYFVLIQIFIAFGVLALVILLTIKIEKPVLNFLNRRWLPKSDAPLILKDDQIENAEIYSTELGEDLELKRNGSWTIMVVSEVLPYALKVIVMGFIIGLIGSAIVTFLKLGSFFGIVISPIIYFLTFSLIIPDYLVKVWLMLHCAVIFFSQNMVFVRAKTGNLFGLITGKVADFEKKITPYGLDQEPEIVTDPRRLKSGANSPDDWLNKLYEFIGATKGTRCLYIPSFYKDASDLFMHIENANAVQRIIELLKAESAEKRNYLERIKNNAIDIKTNKADDKDFNQEEADKKASEYIDSMTKDLLPKRVFNLVAILNGDESVLNNKWNLKEGARRDKDSPTASHEVPRVFTQKWR